jgi:cytochrome c553
MKRILLLLSLSLLAGAAQAESSQPAKNVKTLAQACAACHGENGAKPITPDYPVLAGQYANYLEHSLHEYKAGKRKNAVMAAQVQNLSHADIEALAQYYAAQRGSLYTPSVHGRPHNED